jgi:hypothetical protein
VGNQDATIAVPPPRALLSRAAHRSTWARLFTREKESLTVGFEGRYVPPALLNLPEGWAALAGGREPKSHLKRLASCLDQAVSTLERKLLIWLLK